MADSAFSIYPSLYKIYNGRRAQTQGFRNIFYCNRMAEVVYYGKFFIRKERADMDYPRKEITLKTGEKAVFRSPIADDAEGMLDYLRTVVYETEFLLRTAEDPLPDLESEKRFLENAAAGEGSVMIVCEMDGIIVGNCSMNRGRHQKDRHRASIGIALRKAYWNRGIGTAMFRELTKIAEQWGLEQMELAFIEGNDRGRALYEKMGFRIYAERPNAIHLPDGRVLKEYEMLRPVEKK